LKKKLNCADIKYTTSLRDSLLQGIQKRFGAYFADKKFLMSAVTHPRFKLSWIDDAELRANCTQQLEAAINMQMALSSSDTSAEQTGDQSDVQNVTLDDFFNFNEREMEQSQKHLQFLNDKDRELSMPHRHPEVKVLFLR